jgi:RHS repeat-associated protein
VSLEGAGGIGGLLARSSGYSSGNWTSHADYYSDGNGNVTSLIDGNQSVVASYRYDPFGNFISKSGTLANANVYRFSSKEVHVNSGMYYYGFRFYDPNSQRWINRDPIEEEGGINLFSLVFNNPADFVDPFGLAGDINLGQDHTCRVDSFNTGAGASHEIHVYNGAAEVGVFGPDGWINKHGFTAGPTLPPEVANKLNGVSVNAMRQQGMIPRKGMANIKGLRGRLNGVVAAASLLPDLVDLLKTAVSAVKSGLSLKAQAEEDAKEQMKGYPWYRDWDGSVRANPNFRGCQT